MYYEYDSMNKLTYTICNILSDEKDILDYVNNNLLVFVIDNYDNMSSVIWKIKLLLKNKKMEHDDLYKYLNYMKRIISKNITTNYFYETSFDNIDLSRTPIRLYKLMKLIKECNTKEYYDVFLNNLAIISIIIAYIYANNIDDYSMLYNFLNNLDYYYDKLTLSGMNFNYEELNKIYNFSFEDIYLNIEKIFDKNRDKKMIK